VINTAGKLAIGLGSRGSFGDQGLMRSIAVSKPLRA
jgi:hypothetical protein